MNWSNWIYLGVGLALGIGLRELWARQSSNSSHLTPLKHENFSDSQPTLKQTQLAYRMAHEMSQFKAGFLARTTHVLRSPLNGLIGLHQLILSNLCENPEEEREFIAQAHERALKLLKLIDEILNVARVEHGTNKLDIQPRSLNELLQEVYDLTYMLAENRNFPFKLLAPNPETYVLADYYWLRQILVNLVEVSIGRMEEGSIYLSTSDDPTTHTTFIWLDVPTHAVSSSEPIDLIKSSDLTNHDIAILSSGMKLLLNQTLLEAMKGKLEIVTSPLTKPAEALTRLQISIPFVVPEAGFLP